MATSTKQAVATVPVYDYLLNPGDATLTSSPGLGGKRVKVTLAYDKARSIAPVTWLENLTVYSALTDANGFWQVNLVPTDNITPSGTYYIVEVEGYLSYKINPTLAGVPGIGWQSSAILIDIPPSLTIAGQTVGTLTVTGLLAIGPGEPGIDTSSPGALLIGDNMATSIELGSPLVNVIGSLAIGGVSPWIDVTASSVTVLGVTYLLGADPTGVLDSTTAIQNAFNAANAFTTAAHAGATVFFPPGQYKITSALTPYNGLNMLAFAPSYSSGSPAPNAWLNGATLTVPIINGTATLVDVSIIGLGFSGNNATGSKGLYFANVSGLTLRDLFFTNFGDQAIQIVTSSGGSVNMDNIFVQASLLVRTGRAALIGTVDVNADGTYFQVITAASMVPADGAGSGYICGIVVRGPGMWTNCVGSFAQTGIAAVSGQALTHFTSCRAEFNNGTGWEVDGSTSQYVACRAWRNSRTTNNAFPGFTVTGNQNTFVVCAVDGLSADANQQSNGFSDANNSGQGSNDYVGNRAGQIRGALLVYSGTDVPVEMDWGGPPTGHFLQYTLPLGATLKGFGYQLNGTFGQNDLILNDTGGVVSGMRLQGTSGGGYFRVNGATVFEWINDANSLVVAQISGNDFLIQSHLFPGAEAGGRQSSGGLIHSTGVPSNANGNNNDWAISDNNHLYTKLGGNWQAPLRSLQTPTEAVLVSGINATLGEIVEVTLTAARLVGAPLNPSTGQRLQFVLIQSGAGAFAVTWNPAFKVSWSDAGNATPKRSTIAFIYDGTNWNQDGAQTPYV